MSSISSRPWSILPTVTWSLVSFIVGIFLALHLLADASAQDRSVVGDPLTGSPYDRYTAGKSAASKRAKKIAAAEATPTAVPSTAPSVEPSKKKAFPKSGVLSTVIPSGYGRTGVPSIASPDLDGDTLPPISGSISHAGPDAWSAKVTNNSEDTYSVSIKVNQLASSGSVAKSDTFSATLKPKASIERRFSATSSAQGAQLVLERYTSSASNSKPKTSAPPKEVEAPPADPIVQ